jgi:hypothetical protein
MKKENSKPLNRATKTLLVVGGTLSLAIGVLGAFLPVLPTTPFVLLAAICYLRSSQRLYERLMRSRFANPHVQSILDGKGVPLSVKIFSLAISAVMIGYVSVFVTESFLVRMLLGVLYLVQLIVMVRMKTLKSKRTTAEFERAEM